MSKDLASQIIQKSAVTKKATVNKVTSSEMKTSASSNLSQFSRPDLMTPVPSSVVSYNGYKKITFPDGREFVLQQDGTPFVSERDIPQSLKDEIRGGSFSETGIEVDHIVPKGLGGTDAESNLQPLKDKRTPWQWLKSKFTPNKGYEVGKIKPENRQEGKMVVEHEAINKYRAGEITYWEAMAAVQHWDNKDIRDDFLHNQTEDQGFLKEAFSLLNPINQIKKSATGSIDKSVSASSFINEKVKSLYKKSVLADLVQAVNPTTTTTLEDRIALISGVSRGLDDPTGGIKEGETVEGLAGSGLSKSASVFLFGPSAIPYSRTSKREQTALASTPIRWTAGSLARLLVDFGLEKTKSDMTFTPYTDNQKFIMGDEEFKRLSQADDLYGMTDRYIASTLQKNGVEATTAQKLGLTGAMVMGMVFENPFFKVGGATAKEALERSAKELLEHELGGELSEQVIKEIASETEKLVKLTDPVAKEKAYGEMISKFKTESSIATKEVAEVTDEVVEPLVKGADEAAVKQKVITKVESTIKNPEIKQALDDMDDLLPVNGNTGKSTLFLKSKRQLEKLTSKITKSVQDDWIKVQQLVKAGNGEADPYLKKILFPGRVGARIEQVNDTTKNILQDRIKTANNLKIDSDSFKKTINEYLIVKHAPERNKAVSERLKAGATPDDVYKAERAAGLTTAEAEAKLSEIESLPYFKEVERLADEISNLNKQTMDTLLRGQVISQDLFDTLTKRYKNHVPLNRIFDETEDVTSALTSAGFDVASSGVKTAKGSEREVSDILGNVVANLEQAIARTEKNIVNLEVLKFSRENKELGLFEEIKPKIVGKDFEGKPLLDQKTLIDDPQVLTVRENGKNVYLKIKDKQLAVTFKGLGKEKLPPYLKYVAMYSRFMASLATRFNPDFAFSNKIRDLQETLTYVASQKDMGFGSALSVASKELKLKGMRDVIAGIRGTDSEGARLYRQMIDDGGTTGGLGLSTKKQLEINMDKMEKLVKSKPRKAAAYAFEKIDDWNTIFEDSTRLSVYRRAIDSGATRERAAVLAKEASIDFNRMGTMSPVLNSLYMFSNASFQGSFKMLRAMKNPKVAATVVSTVGGAVWITNEWNDQLDPLWRDKVTKWDRTSNLVVMLPPSDDGSANYVLIPVSWGLKPIKVAADEVYDLSSGIEKDVGDAFEGVFTAILEGYNPVGGTDAYSAVVPTPLDLPSELARNKSWSGSKIKPDWDKNLSPSRQYFDSLRQTRMGRGLINATRFIDDKLGISISPEDADYAINSIIGGAGRFVGKSYETITSIGKDDGVKLDEAPFTGRFYRNRTEDEFSGSGDVPKETTEALREQSNERFDIAERAEVIWNEMKDSDDKAELLQRAIETESEEVIAKIVEIAEDEALDLTYADKQIKMLGVENGARAQRIYETMSAADSRDEALDIVKNYLDKEIISDKVAGQLADLLVEQPLAVLTQ